MDRIGTGRVIGRLALAVAAGQSRGPLTVDVGWCSGNRRVPPGRRNRAGFADRSSERPPSALVPPSRLVSIRGRSRATAGCPKPLRRFRLGCVRGPNVGQRNDLGGDTVTVAVLRLMRRVSPEIDRPRLALPSASTRSRGAGPRVSRENVTGLGELVLASGAPDPAHCLVEGDRVEQLVLVDVGVNLVHDLAAVPSMINPQLESTRRGAGSPKLAAPR